MLNATAEIDPSSANLVGDLVDVNAFRNDVIARAVIEENAPWSRAAVEPLGELVWSADMLTIARDAHRYLPELRTYDRLGSRIDVVEFHPAYHALMATAFEHGVHSLGWTAAESGSHLARAVLSYLWNQLDGASACPTGMAYAAIPTLRGQPELAPFADRVARSGYDPRPLPITEKSAATVGYAMTEKQGGSDLRTNLTVARAFDRGGPGELYFLDGHKWFCSAPMSDGFFTVARTEEGPSCFFVPRYRADGSVNGIRINRLKDKLGNRANASAEIEYHGAHGYLVGDAGRGIRTILTSSDYTRLDFAAGSAGLIRAVLSQALHHADRRQAFGHRLSALPVQEAVLADLALEWAGAAHLAFRVARTLDDSDDVAEHLLGRVLTPVAKYWNCKRAPLVAAEAIECVGGNGYIEEHPLPRYYREAPLNAIWEGTSNMMVLDVARVLAREPKVLEPLLDELRDTVVSAPGLGAALAEIEEQASRPAEVGRRLVSRIALAVQGSLLVRHAPSALADAFCASRLGRDWEPTFGTLPTGTNLAAIVEFARLG